MNKLMTRSLVVTGSLVLMTAAWGSVATTTASNRPAGTQALASAATTAAAPTVGLATAAPPTTTATPPPITQAQATKASTPALSVTYSVSRVVDGDTVDIASSGGPSFRVRVIGIDAPERGVCGATEATKLMRSLVDGKVVVLTMGGDGENSDRYGRLLRFVDVDGVDAGLTLIKMGFAVARYDSRDGYGRHAREDTYVAADEASANYSCSPSPTVAPTTVASAPQPATPKPVAATSTTPTGAVRCDPNYSGCVPIDVDVDCAGGSGNGPSYVTGPVKVIGSDIYGLDRDHDGTGCE